MFAVIQTGGKQYRVEPGKIMKIEKVEGSEGDKVVFDKVLLTSTDEDLNIGKPYLDKVTVAGTIIEQTRDRKVTVFKKKRRKGYQKKQGHRQHVSVVKFDEFSF